MRHARIKITTQTLVYHFSGTQKIAFFQVTTLEIHQLSTAARSFHKNLRFDDWRELLRCRANFLSETSSRFGSRTGECQLVVGTSCQLPRPRTHSFRLSFNLLVARSQLKSPSRVSFCCSAVAVALRSIMRNNHKNPGIMFSHFFFASNKYPPFTIRRWS